MDVNSVLQNTRQYFQGIPSSSPASGELAPGASVGYNSPPVSSATSTATSATNPFPPYKPTLTQGSWSSSAASAAAAAAAVAQQNAAYHSSSSSSSSSSPAAFTQPSPTPASVANNVPPYPRNYSPAVTSASYHFYENAARSPKTSLPLTATPAFVPQHNYTAPSITRTNEGSGMFNMDSIVCQPNVNHLQSKKSKIKTSSLLTTTSSSSANVYKQPTQQLEESRFYGNRLASHPQPPSLSPQTGSATASRVPSITPSHIPTPPPPHHLQQRLSEQPSATRQSYSPRSSQLVEQRVGYQHQVSYQTSSRSVALRTTAVEKTPQREPGDVYFNYRRIETAALETTAATVSKRDSPLDLSVKTIRQSADSTALDDSENAVYGQHFPLPAHQSLRPEGRHPHLPQLPYAPVPGLPGVRTHSSGAQNRSQPHYPITTALPPSFPEPPYTLKSNGQLHDELSRHPVSEFRNDKLTVSITYEQKQQVSSVQYSSHYYHRAATAEGLARSNTRPQQPLMVERGNQNTKQLLPGDASNVPPSVALKSSLTPLLRKRKAALNETPAPVKFPRKNDWRESIDKDIENRLNAYTSMKAKEEEERQMNSASRNSDSYRNEVQHTPHGSLPKKNKTTGIAAEPEPRDQYPHQMPTPPQTPGKYNSPYSPQPTTHSLKVPFTQYLEEQHHKAQHKLPVQPIQMHQPPPPSQQWYQNNVHPHHRPPPLPPANSYPGSPYKPPTTYKDTHSMQFCQSGYDHRDDLKIIQKIENPKLSVDADEQKPLPPFRALPSMNFSSLSPKSTPPPPPAAVKERSQEERERALDVKSEPNSSEGEVSQKDKEDQSRAALMASALSHPRIRTKAELKQVAPVDKSKSKSAEVSKLPDVAVQNLNKFSNRSQFDSETQKPTDVKGYISESKLDVVDDAIYNHRPVSVNSVSETENSTATSSALSSSYVDFNKYSPRKRLFSKSEENGTGVKRSSSETTVFEFRDSDSEAETSSNDLHSLNEMRKDRKSRTPSATPTTIDQLNEGQHSDDSQWMEACDELINQFSFNNMKKRGRKKKTAIDDSSHDDEPSSPKKKFLQDEKSEESEEETPEKVQPVCDEMVVIPAEKIKKEIVVEEANVAEKATLNKGHMKEEVKKEDLEIPPEARAVERKVKDVVQHESQERKTTKEVEKEVQERKIKREVEKESQERKIKRDVDKELQERKTTRDVEKELQERKIKKEIEKESQERRTTRDVEKEEGKAEKQTSEIRGQRSNVSTTRIRIQNLLEDSSDTDDNLKEKFVSEKKTKNVKEIQRKALAKALAQKNKKILKKKQKKKNRKTAPSKKLKKVDVKREKMRHMILRRMETRKSKLDAMKSLRKTKPEKPERVEKAESNVSSDDSQPIMTRKMARRECQKDSRRPEEAQKKPVVLKTTRKVKPVEKEEKRTTKEKTERQEKLEKDKAEKRDKSEQEKAEKQDEKTKKSTKDERTKRNERLERLKKMDKDTKSDTKDKTEDVTRRSLRSRNVVVVSNEKFSKKLKKKVLNNAKEKPKSPIKVKKETKNELKNDQKNEDKEKEKDKTEKKPETDPSWEEELFKYKYSLRMPVKLINLARPTNWPKGNGGCSSLPDLDRSEADSDLLNDVVKQKTPKKKNNRDETKFSNTKEFKDSVKYLKEKFDKKIEEKNQQEGSSLTKLMMEKKMKIIPKSSDGPELLPTPSVEGFKSKFSSKTDASKRDERRSKDSCKNNGDDEDKDEVVEESLIGYFRKETVDVFKEVFEKHNNKVHNQFTTVILESRTRTQTKEMKHDATLKRVFGMDRPASAPPIQETNDVVPPAPPQSQEPPQEDKKEKNSLNGVHKPWQNFTKLKFLMSEEGTDSDKDSKDFEDAVDFVTQEEDAKDTNAEIVVKKKSRQIRRKCRSSGFDYIRKKKKIKKEEDTEETVEEREKKKPPVSLRPNAESVEDIQNEIRSWVVNKGIGETVLHKAARLGYLDISSYCLEKLQCLPSPTDNAGYTPLHEACTRGHLKIAKMLLKFGADVSASARGGIRPLHEAVENGNVELVRLLLSYGADPLLSTYTGQTPLSLVKEDQDDLKEFLLLYLADIQGNPSKPWPFSGIDDFDRETNGYDPLTEMPSSNNEELETLEIEMSDLMLPNLYRFKDEFDYWVLCSDLPNRIREIVVKAAQDQNPPPYIVRKITRTDFDENVECVMLLQNKYLQKTKSKCPLISLVKYTEKLVSVLSIQKISMSFS